MDIKSSISKRERALIVVTIAVIFSMLVYSFVIEPLYKEYNRLSQEISTKELHLAKNLRLLKERKSIEEEFSKHSQHLKTKKSDEEEMAEVLSEIERIGKEANIHLTDVKPQKIRDHVFYRLLTVEIKFEADTESLANFIYDLKNSNLMLKVKRLQINTKGQENSLLEGILQVSKIILS